MAKARCDVGALPLSSIRSETGGLRSTGVTRFHRYYTPIRHPPWPSLSLASVSLLGCQPCTIAHFPCCTVDLSHACCHHYPG
jgi:hypothetical protein